MPGRSSPEARKRRVERTAHGEQLTMQMFLALLLVHLLLEKIRAGATPPVVVLNGED